MGNPVENTTHPRQSSIVVDKSSENATSVELVDPGAGHLPSSEVGSTSIMTLGAQVSTGNGESTLNDASSMDLGVASFMQQNEGAGAIWSKPGCSQKDYGVPSIMQPVNNTLSSFCLGKESKQPSVAKAMEFDPIRRHRHFCPWIVSSNNSAPGWKQTLNALQRKKEFSFPLSMNALPSSLIEVDDPIGSVKKLLTPPSAKRKKLAYGST